MLLQSVEAILQQSAAEPEPSSSTVAEFDSAQNTPASTSCCNHCHAPQKCPSLEAKSTQTDLKTPTLLPASRIFQLSSHDQEVVTETQTSAGTASESTSRSSSTGDKLAALSATSALASQPHAADVDIVSSSESFEDSGSDVDPTYRPPETEHESDVDSASELEGCDTPPDPVSDRKYIVNDNQLDQLFLFCRQCGKSVVNVEKKEIGSMLVVETLCIEDHTMVWHSQPHHGQGWTLHGCGTWIIAAAILLSGGSFQGIALFASLLNLAFIGEHSFYYTQKNILCPVIDKVWRDHITVVQGYFRGGMVDICGDGRCDSPGYSAKYGRLFYTDNDES